MPATLAEHSCVRPTFGAHVKDYAYIDSQSDRATIHGGISPLQGGEPRVVVYAEVENISETVSQAVELGATIVQDPYDVPGVTIAVIADPQGTVIGIAQPRRQSRQ